MGNTVTVRRKELYRRLWTEPVSKLSKEYGLSDVGLAKICRKHEVPRPPRGFWARRAAGQMPPQTALTRAEEDWDITITSHRVTVSDPALKRQAEKEVAEARMNENPIVVPETLRSAHPLVCEALQVMESAQKGPNGILERPAAGCLDVAVSKNQLRRALRIMDAIIKALEVRGFPVRVADGKHALTRAELMGVDVNFAIAEQLETVKEEKDDDETLDGSYRFRHSSFRNKTVPSGRLVLAIDTESCYHHDGLRRKWSDGVKQRIENALPQFMAGLINVAAAKAESERQRQERERQWEKEEQRRKEEERLRAAAWAKIQAERAKVQGLMKDAADWQTSKGLREYIQAVRDDASAQGKDSGPESKLGKWLVWAEQQADRLDPLKTSPASILDDEAKYRPPADPWRR